MSRDERSIAVIVRAHAPSAKVDALIAAASGHRAFDAYVSVNETAGGFDTGPAMRAPYTLDTFRSLGFEPQDDGFIIQCSDLLFEHYRRALPGYDVYVLIEYDVELVAPGGAWLDQLAGALRSPTGRNVDLAGVDLSYRGDGWSHHANAARLFPTVWMTFFPVVALSARAIRHLYALRLDEGPRDMPTADRVFCEAMVGSAMVSDDRFEAVDLNTLCPGSWSRRSFYWGLPMLMRQGPAHDVAMRHPVYAAPAFLHVHVHDAAHHDTLVQFRAVVEDPALPLPEDERRAALDTASDLAARIAADRPRVRAPGGRLSAPLPVVVHAAGGDGAGLDDTCLTPIGGGRTVLDRVADELHAVGVDKVYVCVTPGAAGLRPWAEGRAAVRLVDVAPGETRLQTLRRLADRLAGRPFLTAPGDTWSDVDAAALADAEGELGSAVAAWPSGLVAAVEGRVSERLDAPPWLGLGLTHTGWLLARPGLLEAAWPHESLEALLARLYGQGRLGRTIHRGGFEPQGGAAALTAIAALEVDEAAYRATS